MTLRRKRLKAVYEGRCRQLQVAKNKDWFRTTDEHNQVYAHAVHKYVRARTAWRAFRGWV